MKFNWQYLIPIWGQNKLFYDIYKAMNAKAPAPGRPPQMSAYGKSLALVYGRTRITGNVIYLGPLGIGGWHGSLPRMLALCEGPITGIGRVWRDKDTKATPGEYRLTVFTGTRPTQTAWSALPSGKDLGYPGVAMVATDLPGIAQQLTQMSYEVKGLLHATGDATNGDAHPADILGGTVASPGSSMLLHPEYGAAFPFSVVTDTGRDGSANSSYRRYTTAEGLWISPAFTAPKSARDHLQEVLDSTNATCLWTSGLLEIVPLGDQSVTGNSVTYTPAVPVQYALTASDLIPQSDGSRVRMTLPSESDTYNNAPVEFLERAPTAAAADPAHAYNAALADDPDPVDVFSVRGERKAPLVQLHAICQRPIALKIARIRAQRLLRLRASFEFTIGWRFARLEPLDFVSITDDLLGLSAKVVRIRKIRENSQNGNLTIEAVEWPIGVGSAVAHTTTSSDSDAPAVDPYDTEGHFHERLCSAWFAATVPSGHDLFDVAWTGARFVAVGSDGASSGRCATSDDGGLTYTARTIPVPVKAVLYDAVHSTLIAVGSSTKAATSTDGGTTWTDRSAAIPTGSYEALATDGAGLVVAVGFNVCATSTDGGVTWTARTIPSGSFRGVAWTGPWRDGFVAVGGVAGTSVCATSTANGQTWTSRTMPSGSFIGVTRDVSGLVVAIGLTGVIARSLDGGVTWVAVTTGMTEDLYDILHTGQAWIVVGRTGVTLTAIHDALTWTKRAVAVTTVGRAIGWNGQRLVVVDQAAGAYSLEV